MLEIFQISVMGYWFGSEIGIKIVMYSINYKPNRIITVIFYFRDNVSEETFKVG